MARKTIGKQEKWKPLFEVKTDNFKAQGTWKNPDEEAAFIGYINLIDEYFSIKCSVVKGKNGAFISMPQVKSGKDYYSQVVPLDKDIAKELSEIAELCESEFDNI